MKTHHVPTHFMPYPELVEPRKSDRPFWIGDTSDKPWLPSNGFTNLTERLLFVPLTPEGHRVALHELAHVKWSPKRVPKDLGHDYQYLIAVEDARVNLGLANRGLALAFSAAERAHVAHLAREDWNRKCPAAFVLRSVASLGTNGRHDVLCALRSKPQPVRALVLRCVRLVHSRLQAARRRTGREVASWRLTRQLAAELSRILERELPPLGYSASLPSLPKFSVGCGFGHSHPGARARTTRGTTRTASARAGIPGRMRIARPPLDVPYAAQGRGRLVRGGAAREGVYVRHAYRQVLDGAIFQHRRRRPGGTVLIDVSGSMSLDAMAIDRILAASSGAAQVAMYSGEEDTGELRLIARDGRRADARHLKPVGRGNIVDEPALRWLALQPHPRLWISDGGVTGVGDAPSVTLKHRCRELCERSGIRRVETVADAVRQLAGRE